MTDARPTTAVPTNTRKIANHVTRGKRARRTAVSGFALADPHGVITQKIVEPEQRDNARFNDGAVDTLGRFWAGTLNYDRSLTSALYCLHNDGCAEVKETGVGVSNGIGWSPDGRTMYFVDSVQKAIFAYDYDVDHAIISGKRVFVDTYSRSGTPDGLTVDEEECVWCAFWDGWCVVRYDQYVNEQFAVQMPVARPTACIFGGENRNMLYITTARHNLSPIELEYQVNAGGLFVLETATRGIPAVDCRMTCGNKTNKGI